MNLTHDASSTGYSGGMKRRLNLTCSPMHEPRLVLLDKPTFGVDPLSRRNILDAIAELAREGAPRRLAPQ